MFRTLTKDDVEVRVQQIKRWAQGCAADLLIYKNVRVDRAILNETFGMFGWQSKFEVVNDSLFCTISIKDTETGEWIAKQDVGTESNVEMEKGQASDAFKRAAFAWGIGEELYTSPKIKIFPQPGDYNESNGKYYLNATPFVNEMIVDPETRKIKYLEIALQPDAQDRKAYVCFTFGRKRPTDERINSCAAWVIESGNTEQNGIDLLAKSYTILEEDKVKLHDAITNLESLNG